MAATRRPAQPPQPPPTTRPPRQIRRGAAPASSPQAAPPKNPNNIAKPPPPAGPNLKRLIWTGAFAAITIVGAIYGAGLKTQQEYKQEKQKIVEASVEDRVRNLEQRRAALVTQRAPLERKLAELQARIRAQESAGAGADAGAEGKK
ncbi:hypothetical protein M426DRAFT_8725 [Hypoxylon sp. CI-4A]|nr:hypothetical protein M426DRAFT_8725 [Hypoxylon sp. CI-4A]